ncbi:hypothetical protein ANO14919_010170 [Xylariales sp. No.14919]|nr:hypothetical protein F5X98DRAFT_369689 [Xylaria grammica]GAW11669.1 hypothetical protein ANO14919_010170 [Xylariales sp. No.14919]
MSEPQKPGTETAAKCVFSPVKDNPDEAEKFVRAILEHEPNNVDLVAAELAPLYGFGPNSNQDVLARSRAQSIFVSPEIQEPLKEFLALFVRNRWGLPLPKWDPTLALVREHRHSSEWNGPKPPINEGGRPEEYYARFLIRVLHELEHPVATSPLLLKWLRDAVQAGGTKEENACWVLFHGLMYLQLKAMDLRESQAPLKARVQNCVARLASHNSCFDLLSLWIATRRDSGR